LRLICNFAARGSCDQFFSWQFGSNQGIVGVDIDWFANLFFVFIALVLWLLILLTKPATAEHGF
jgi:hypothetical protein